MKPNVTPFTLQIISKMMVLLSKQEFCNYLTYLIYTMEPPICSLFQPKGTDTD